MNHRLPAHVFSSINTLARSLSRPLGRPLSRSQGAPQTEDSEGLLVVVACSGGLDSVVLAHSAVRGGCSPVVLVHIDHGLRSGPERNRDREVVSRLGEELNVPVRFGALNRSEIVESEEGEGVEERARTLRYRVLGTIAEEIAKEIADEQRPHPTAAQPRSVPFVIATAHHRGDQAETVLMRILTGRSAHEQMTIPARRILGPQGTVVVRPLLDVGPDVIHGYANFHNLTWHVDSTNRDTRFFRNFVRHDLMAPTAERYPGVTASVARFGIELDELREAMEELIPPDYWGERDQDGIWRTDTARFLSLPGPAQELVLRRALKGVSRNQRVSFAAFRDFLQAPTDLERDKLVVSVEDVSLSVQNGTLELRRDVVRTVESGYLFVVREGRPIVVDNRFTVAAGRDGAECGCKEFWSPVSPPVIVRSRRRGDSQRSKKICRSDSIFVEDTIGVIAEIAPDGTYTLREEMAVSNAFQAFTSSICVQLT